MTPHIVTSYDQDLSHLTDLLARMGGRTEEQFTLALNALERRDEALATVVVQGDGPIDQTELQINEQVLRLLVLRAPVADDLRRVLTTLKIAHILERIADHARRLARMVPVFNQGPALPLMVPLLRMGRMVERLLHQCLNAYLARDVPTALALRTQDEEVDRLDRTLIAATTDHMQRDLDTIPLCAHILFASRTLERIGDHAVTLAALTAYEVVGQHAAGEREKAGHSSPVGA